MTIIADTGGEGENGDGDDSEGSSGNIDSVSLADGNGNAINVTVRTSNVGGNTELRIRSLRPEDHQNDVRDETRVEAENGENTYSVLGSNNDQADRVRIELIGENGTVLHTRTVDWSQ